MIGYYIVLLKNIFFQCHIIKLYIDLFILLNELYVSHKKLKYYYYIYDKNINH